MTSVNTQTVTSTSGYELLDMGRGAKLERFGQYILIRPEPEAEFETGYTYKKWLALAHSRFNPDSKTAGNWEKLKDMPDEWEINFEIFGQRIILKLRLTGFKHVGVFPEQVTNWKFVLSFLKEINNQHAKVLNLFAYTGAASINASLAGANVTHVEALKQLNGWCHENMALSKTENIRLINDDVVKFVKREIRRCSLYDGIILDPPAFGRGPKGENWKLERDVGSLLSDTKKMLNPESHFLVLNMYSSSSSMQIVNDLMRDIFPESDVSISNVIITDSFGKNLNTGVIARIQKNKKKGE